jgi:hypothetical protein
MKISAMKERFFEFRDAVSPNRVRGRRTGVSKNSDIANQKSINADPGLSAYLQEENDHAII